MRNILFFTLITLLGCARSTPSTSTAKESQAKGDATKAGTTTASKEESKTSKEGIQITEAIVCRSMEQRNPSGEGNSFPADVGRLYLYSKVNLEKPGETSIKHIWHYANKEVATVTLPIRSNQWRTYSSKAIDPASKGEWKVEIKSPSDELLKTIVFQVQ